MTPFRAVRRACVCLCSMSLLMLTGCSTPGTKPTEASPFWSGRLGLQVQTSPPQSWSASFELSGSAEQGQMRLFSPVGTTLARLRWTPQTALLEQGQSQTESDNLQSLIQRLTGTDLPMSALFAWLAGRTSDVPGWQVDLSAHPQGRLTAKRTFPAPEAVLRIVIDP